MAEFNPAAFKATTHQQWNAVAERWNAWGPLLDHWLGPVTEILLDMAEVRPGSRVLHIAGGSGQEALQSARRVGPSGFVLTTDFSEALTELAGQNLAAAGLDNAQARLMDGEDFVLDEAAFDAVLSRVGLIFFPDQVGSVRHQAATLKPGGRVGAIVYAAAEECRFFSDPVAVIRRRAQLPPPLPGQPGPFSLGAPGRIDELFAAAGLVDIDVRKVEAPLILESAAECLRFEQESFGALHQMLGGLDEAAKSAAWNEVGESLAAFQSNGRFEGPCAMVIAVGRKA
ncbi:MAG: methyltransferase domain-containing protein [Alphaproteobacteria bacterium]